MRASALLLALAGAVSAVDYSEWLQHNGLVTTYNKIIKEHGQFADEVAAQDDITAFVPTNTAMSKWLDLPSTRRMSYTAVEDTFRYMIIKGNYAIDDLEHMNGQKLQTMLQDETVLVRVRGVSPLLDVVISSGDDYDTNSTAGIANTDFALHNGKVQLIDTVFQLPENILERANRNPRVNAAPKASFGLALLLPVVGAGLMALF